MVRFNYQSSKNPDLLALTSISQPSVQAGHSCEGSLIQIPTQDGEGSFDLSPKLQTLLPSLCKPQFSGWEITQGFSPHFNHFQRAVFSNIYWQFPPIFSVQLHSEICPFKPCREHPKWKTQILQDLPVEREQIPQLCWALSVVALPEMSSDKIQLWVYQWVLLNMPPTQQALLSSGKAASKIGMLNSRGESKTQDREYQNPIEQWGWKMHICSPENTSFTGTCPRCIYHLHNHGSRY